MKTMIKCVFDVLEKPKNSSIVDSARVIHELTILIASKISR